jgi:hypothetical protein
LPGKPEQPRRNGPDEQEYPAALIRRLPTLMGPLATRICQHVCM